MKQNTNKVEQGQSFVDMVCMLSGSYEEVINAAILNGKSVTGDLTIGESVTVGNVVNTEAAEFLNKNKPATNVRIENSSSISKLEGIGYWIIEKDFIVS